MEKKNIFISHSSKDKIFASWLSNLLVCLGVDHSSIFYSSDFTQGVQDKISDEVRQAIEESLVDIIVWSNNYERSRYCLNEEGIIWGKGGKSDRIIIALTSSSNDIQSGFINGDYIQLHLTDANFLDYLLNHLIKKLSKYGLVQINIDMLNYNKLINELNAYKQRMPIHDIEALKILYGPEESQQRERRDIQKAWENIQTISYKNPEILQTYQDIFYKEYTRHIQLFASNKPGLISVKTTTNCIIVNLSDRDYVEKYSSQFLKKDGGYDTFSESFNVNGEDISCKGTQGVDQMLADNPYKIHRGPSILIRAYSSSQIEFTTQYDISPDMFFQSKVLHIPCANYLIKADLNDSVIKQLGAHYVFRSEFFPPTPHNLRNGTVPTHRLPETSDKQHLHYQSSVGYPAGGGYALTISRVKTIETE